MQTPLQPPKNKWTIIELITWTTGYFKTHNIDSPRSTAEIFLAHVLSLRRIDLYLRYDQPLTEEELSQFKALIRRRIRREPVAYILGLREFWSLELQVTPHTLIPRPETECLIEASLSCLPELSPSAENGRDFRTRALLHFVLPFSRLQPIDPRQNTHDPVFRTPGIG